MDCDQNMAQGIGHPVDPIDRNHDTIVVNLLLLNSGQETDYEIMIFQYSFMLFVKNVSIETHKCLH